MRRAVTVEPPELESGKIRMCRTVSAARFCNRGHGDTTILNRLTQILLCSFKRDIEGCRFKADGDGRDVATTPVRRHIIDNTDCIVTRCAIIERYACTQNRGRHRVLTFKPLDTKVCG